MSEKVKDLENQIAELQTELKNERIKDSLEILSENRKFVNKYYRLDKDKNSAEYLRIISEFSINENHVSCLKFRLPLKIEVNSFIGLAYDRFPFCEIKSEPYWIDDIFIKELSNYTEISKEEFVEKAKECFDQLTTHLIEKEDIIKVDNNCRKLIY